MLDLGLIGLVIAVRALLILYSNTQIANPKFAFPFLSFLFFIFYFIYYEMIFILHLNSGGIDFDTKRVFLYLGLCM